MISKTLLLAGAFISATPQAETFSKKFITPAVNVAGRLVEKSYTPALIAMISAFAISRVIYKMNGKEIFSEAKPSDEKAKTCAKSKGDCCKACKKKKSAAQQKLTYQTDQQEQRMVESMGEVSKTWYFKGGKAALSWLDRISGRA